MYLVGGRRSPDIVLSGSGRLVHGPFDGRCKARNWNTLIPLVPVLRFGARPSVWSVLHTVGQRSLHLFTNYDGSPGPLSSSLFSLTRRGLVVPLPCASNGVQPQLQRLVQLRLDRMVGLEKKEKKRDQEEEEARARRSKLILVRERRDRLDNGACSPCGSSTACTETHPLDPRLRPSQPSPSVRFTHFHLLKKGSSYHSKELRDRLKKSKPTSCSFTSVKAHLQQAPPSLGADFLDNVLNPISHGPIKRRQRSMKSLRPSGSRYDISSESWKVATRQEIDWARKSNLGVSSSFQSGSKKDKSKKALGLLVSEKNKTGGWGLGSDLLRRTLPGMKE
ncbi:unnamed protein product [Dovyalis caffra]|uniref:Uncharacterized protein n=1 Tax=Dovyalis caffra TaxID=77055 RepID=A0AAV1R830_9ROSI|nr:unnamed protein product [Dovyalis caffra]